MFKKIQPYFWPVLSALFLGIAAGMFALRVKSNGDTNDVQQMILDSLRSEVNALKIQRAGDERIALSLRGEINRLKGAYVADSIRIAQYDHSLISIKKQYDQIAGRYANLSADSTARLFERVFGGK